MKLGDLITNKRKKKGLTMRDLANLVGVSEGTVSRWESGEIDNMRRDNIAQVAKVLDIPIHAMMGWAAPDDLELSSIPGISVIKKITRVPILGVIACGAPVFAEENLDGYFGIDTDMIPNVDFCLRAEGDSMIDAGIYDGDIVFLKRTPEVENGQIAAVLIDDSATLKKVYKMDSGLLLQPCNSAYEPRMVNDGVSIIGEYVGVYHSAHKN